MEAQVKEPGAIVLSARLLGEILRRMLDDVVSISVDAGCSVHIACGPTSFDIMGSSDEDFPELPSVGEGNVLTLAQGALRSMIGQTIFAVSDNESRPIHTGALFEGDGKQLSVVAVDGYRLALRREELTAQSGVLCGPRSGLERGGENLRRLGRPRDDHTGGTSCHL